MKEEKPIAFKEELKDIMVKQINGLTDVIVEVNWVLTAIHSDGRVKENNQIIILNLEILKTVDLYK